jgi:lysophospholipase L1-like esterase
MDPNLTRRGKPPVYPTPPPTPPTPPTRFGGPPPPPPIRRAERSPNPPGRRPRTVLAMLAGLALIAGLAFAGTSLLLGGEASPTASGLPSPAAVAGSASPSASPAATPSTSALPSQPPTATPIPSLAPSAAPVPLPALLGAIGDSYSQAWSVSPAYLYDHPQFSWVVGTAKSDGVTSVLERLRALGGSPAVVDAATSGKKMDDAARQADLVVAASKKLPAGATAYVTFELGTNDLCASPDAMTAPATFNSQLQAAMTTLRAGLPAGSRILLLAVPDFGHFRTITQADATARATLAQSKNLNRCAPYLGRYSAAAMTKANSYLALYDAGLKAVCDSINATEGVLGRLHCTYNQSGLAESDFTIKDLSTVDYFHPSLTGQARMAAAAWQADIWATWTRQATPAP